jgi:thiol:disulfide interchange protein DsbD
MKPLGESFTPSEPFEKKTVDLGFAQSEQEIHHGTIAWSRDYEVLPPAEEEGFGVKGTMDYQTCTTVCIPKSVSFDLKSDAALVRGPLEPPSPEIGAEEEAAPKDARAARLAALLGERQASDQNGSASASTTDEAKEKGLLWFIVAAVVAGFAALLTPCVYPMVPITISFFLKQSEKQHHRPMTLALVYCGGIIATFTGLGLLIAALFEATDLNRLANNVGLNLMLTGVILFFGISMLGVFEIRVPSWLLTWSAGKEQKGGIIGTLFMALTFTLVSFTCTFAFAGGLLVMASKGEFFWPIVGMLAFSGAFAFPFFFLALFPKMLSKLPKSGGWMNIIKVSMGFLEIGAALKFLSVADSIWFGQPTYLPYPVVMGAWFALALLAGLYPLGVYRMPHDTPGKFTFGRLAFGAPFLALAGMIGTALFTSYQPSGWVWDNIAAFAPPRFHAGAANEGEAVESAEVAAIGPYVLEHDNLVYGLDFLKALDYARETNQPLFIDFTGQNCVNCRKMEHKVLPQPQVRERLEKFVRVQVFVDEIPLIEDEAEREWLRTMNRKLHLASGDLTMPIYVVLNPHNIAENGQLNRLSNFSGMEQNTGDFAKFLDAGLERFQQATSPNAVETASDAGQNHPTATASMLNLK